MFFIPQFLAGSFLTFSYTYLTFYKAKKKVHLMISETFENKVPLQFVYLPGGEVMHSVRFFYICYFYLPNFQYLYLRLTTTEIVQNELIVYI